MSVRPGDKATGTSGGWLPLAIAGIVLILVSMLAACSVDRSRHLNISNRAIRVVATTSLVGDLVNNIGGDRVEVVTLMGPGIDPHLYKARERDVIHMADADIIFYGGLHLEGAMTEVLEKLARRSPTAPVTGSIPVEELLSPQNYHGLFDPHVWFDVRLWMKAADAVRQNLAALDSSHAALYRTNYETYLERLEELHRYVLAQIGTIPENRRILITAHDAFAYFGRAYGVRVIGLQGISTAAEAGAADVRDLAETIVTHRIPALFVESSVPRQSIEAVQAAVRSRGFSVSIGGELFSDALGTKGTPEGTYIGMIKFNVDTIVAALKGDGETGK